MIIIFGSNYDSSTNEVIHWLERFSQSVVLYRRIEDYKNVSINIIDKMDIKSVWYRKYEMQMVSSTLNTKIVTCMIDEYNYYLKYINEKLENCKSLGGFTTMDMNKLLVLKEAKKSGLLVPDFIVTTSKVELMEFFNRYSSIITKPIYNGSSVNLNDQCQGIMYTSLITNKILSSLPDKFFPSLFQEYIKKEIELRIFFLDGTFYSTAIFNQTNQDVVDCRIGQSSGRQRLVPFKLPIEIEKNLNELMKKLGLNTGSIDMIKTPDSKYVFLEVNPVGLFDEVSNHCNYSLNKKVAEWLST